MSATWICIRSRKHRECNLGYQASRWPELLTHDPAVPYLDYVRALAANPVARAVKRADLMHNMDETRYAGSGLPAEEDLARRRKKYRSALEILDEADACKLDVS